MLFSSLIFLFMFLPLFFICYFIAGKRKNRNIILLLFSLAFYAWGEPIYIVLMILSIVFNYYIAIYMEKLKKSERKRKQIFIFGIVINILALAVFKYLDFIIDTVNIIPSFNIPLANIALPIGISFYTFQIMSYIIAVYQKKVKVQKSILYLGCYIAAFPQLIAGPIVRYSDVDEEIEERHESIQLFASGIRRFIIGFGKKIIIADNLAFVASQIFMGSANEYGFIGSWIGIICYGLQVYYDFSGYSDMALGLGKMLGFNYLENFNYPYIAKSVTDFWRRWHISLSSFFRDYVYIPLGGNRCSILKHIRNILIVWLLTGLWHGAEWTFVFWGGYFGIILMAEKYFIGKYLEKSPSIIQHLYTLLVVIISWVLFRSASVKEMLDISSSMLFINGLGNIKYLEYFQIIQVKYIIIFITGIIATIPFKNLFITKINKSPKLQYFGDILLIIIMLLSLLMILSGSYSPFIYFRF